MGGEPSRLERLVVMLAEALGDVAARAAIHDASVACNIDVQYLSEDGVHVLLKKMAEAPGLIGVTAQLVSARVRMQSVQQRMRKDSTRVEGNGRSR